VLLAGTLSPGVFLCPVLSLSHINRKTGIGLPDLGARDEHGMAPIDGLFSSPEKGTPLPGDDQTQGAMDMDLESGTACW